MFKTFDPSRDIKTQISSINEVLVLNGVVFTGTQQAEPNNIKRYNHWASGSSSGSIYQSLYNTVHTGAAAVELLNITYGQSISSSYYVDAVATNRAEKSKMYRLHAKMLLGDEDLRFNISGSDRDDLIFVHFKRSQMKDELKKGSISLQTMFSGNVVAGIQSVFSSASFSDAGAENRYSSTDRGDVGNLTQGALICGQVYYNAGVLVLIPHIFSNTSSVSTNPGNFWYSGSGIAHDYNSLAISGNFERVLDGIRTRVQGMTIINQTNLQSTFYFCRALNDEFNYSSNPTFLDASQRIIPTSGSNNLQTRTYLTKVGLLGENQELLAVASIGEPLKKSPDTELVIKVRLDN